MAKLDEVVAFLDRELATERIPDYPGAVNGLQLENGGTVSKVMAAVDASLPVIRAAVAAGADLLLVHHGLFWQGVQPLRGPWFRKLKTAMDANLAVYSSHLPLDVHPQWGNNILLARALGITGLEPVLEWKGLHTGLLGELSISREELAERLREALGGVALLCPGGPADVRRVAVVTGGAGSEVAMVAATGADTFITGEGPHWSYAIAEELGINVFYGGHYATETFGVRALAETLAQRFGLQHGFIDHPTGL